MFSFEKFNNFCFLFLCLFSNICSVPLLSFSYPLTEMTEEEQFALALKMSEQEAREMNSQEEEEEELLRKAIAESLNVNMLR